MNDDDPARAREKAAWLRFTAAQGELEMAKLRTAAAALDASAALTEFGRAWQSGVDVELAAMPDLMELDAQMAGLYDFP